MVIKDGYHPITEHIAKFISNYAKIHGLPQPAAGRGRAVTAPIYFSRL